MNTANFTAVWGSTHQKVSLYLPQRVNNIFFLLMKRIVDVHTHLYLPKYLDILRSRTQVPRIFNHNAQDRLIILPNEELDESTRLGRPIGPEYVDANHKLDFMAKHAISTSVLSLANPWLDFLKETEVASVAQDLNQDMQEYCNQSSQFFGFGVLPVNSPHESVLELERIANLNRLRGAIIGTWGCGKGLDDPRWEPVFAKAEELNLMLFLHPHYGIPNEVYGEIRSGHVLPLALGFPFETTIAVSRMILCGIFDRYPNLKLLLAHSGGTLPFLAGRLDSCVEHDPHVANRLMKNPSDYLKALYYDAVNYHEHGLENVKSMVGRDRIMFGTDNPFFPPLSESIRWPSVDSNYDAIEKTFGPSDDILGENAIRVLNLK
jgi:aminocarboxymuconate-semialdehyde decarboxylase